METIDQLCLWKRSATPINDCTCRPEKVQILLAH